MTPATRATMDDLMKMERKAELLGGRIVELMATGRKPNRLAGRIYRRLDDYALATGIGEAYTDNMGYAVPELASGRQSFSPDASYYSGPFSANEMRWIDGPPTFAVEVRSENDYGDAAEEEMAAKRPDYFQAGTRVVWDVDPVAEIVRRFRSNEAAPVVFRRSDVIDAEPAVPGWTMNVDDMFL